MEISDCRRGIPNPFPPDEIVVIIKECRDLRSPPTSDTVYAIWSSVVLNKNSSLESGAILILLWGKIQQGQKEHSLSARSYETMTWLDSAPLPSRIFST